MEEIPDQNARLDAIRAERNHLIEQIRQSERTIERSRDLLKQLDALLIADDLNPKPQAVQTP